jgi:catechol 2,3-dioxygenase-like lactoylglutathione lyase family enzyme
MPVAPDIKKIDSVPLNVRDLERSALFYSDVLGLPEILRVDEQNVRGFGVGDNSTTINDGDSS